VRDDRLKDLRPVRHGAEHVGHIAAVAQRAVVDSHRCGTNLSALQPGNSWHKNPPLANRFSHDTARPLHPPTVASQLYYGKRPYLQPAELAI